MLSCKTSNPERGHVIPEVTGSSEQTPGTGKDPVKLIRTEIINGSLQGDLKVAQKSDLAINSVALFAPEADGYYAFSCSKGNTSGNQGRSQLRLADIPANTDFVNLSLMKIQGPLMAITFAVLKHSECWPTNQKVDSLDAFRYILLCESVRDAQGDVTCLLKKAFYMAIDDAAKLNRMHYCGFDKWVDGQLYDVTNRDCNQGYVEFFSDNSTKSENRSLTGNKGDQKIVMRKFEWHPEGNYLITTFDKATEPTIFRNFSKKISWDFFSALENIQNQ
jgi:hypothetical protein